MNYNYNLIKISGNLVKKKYSTRERFDCELRNNQIFNERGFRVPEIISRDELANEIVFRFIDGHTGFMLSDEEILLCIKELVKIYKWRPLRRDIEIAKEHYIDGLKKGIIEFINTHNLTLDARRLGECLDTLRSNFDVSLFKDAKPTNWIFDQKGVWLIDFDYVRPSFYLADMAQFLNYQELSDEEAYRYVDMFNDLIEVRHLQAHLLFDMAAINSRIMAIHYNENLNAYYKNKFIEAIENQLRRMQIV